MRKMAKSICMAIVLLVISILLSGCVFDAVGTHTSKTGILLNDYLIIEEEGENGKGILNISVDYEKLLADNEEYVVSGEYESLPSWVKYAAEEENEISAIRVLLHGVPAGGGLYTKTFDIQLSKSSMLKNGDVVSVVITDSPSKFELLNRLMKVKIKYENFDYTISNLHE